MKIDIKLATETLNDLGNKMPDDEVSLCEWLSRRNQLELTLKQAERLMKLMEGILANRRTEEEHKALKQFAKENGRSWKTVLNIAWMEGQNNSVLQQLRNSADFGPSGLILYKLPK